MDFTFSEDQLLFRDSVRDFLQAEVSTESIRARWQTDDGRSAPLWAALAELGLNGMLVPEAQGGLGMNEVDFILLAEECGRAALPEPLLDTALCATPLLAACSEREEIAALLQQITAGDASVAVQAAENALVADAEFATHLVLPQSDGLYLAPAASASLQRQESVDPSRRLYSVEWDAAQALCLKSGEQGRLAQADLFNRGALGTAAQLLGLAQRMMALSVDYSCERSQFGKAIGSFQAVKHHMANIAVKTEFAKAPVYRAAYSLANQLPDASQHVSHAKLAASEAALLAAKSGIQVHGAMGYTWEVDLQIFMKRAWALVSAWGTQGEHKARLGSAVFADQAELGAGHSFASATLASATNA